MSARLDSVGPVVEALNQSAQRAVKALDVHTIAELLALSRTQVLSVPEVGIEGWTAIHRAQEDIRELQSVDPELLDDGCICVTPLFFPRMLLEFDSKNLPESFRPDTDVRELGFRVRAQNVLGRRGIRTVRDLLATTPRKLLATRACGAGTVSAIRTGVRAFVFSIVRPELRFERLVKRLSPRARRALSRLNVADADGIMQLDKASITRQRNCGERTWREIAGLREYISRRLFPPTAPVKNPESHAWCHKEAVRLDALQALPLFSETMDSDLQASDLHSSYLPGLPLADLHFPVRALGTFQRLELHHLGKLLLTSGETLLANDNFGRLTLAKVRQIVEQKILRANSVAVDMVDLSSFQNMVQSYVQHLLSSERDTCMTMQRMRFTGEGVVRYRDLAKQHAITESRVSQVLARSMAVLSTPGNLDLLDRFWSSIDDIVREHGGITKFGDLAIELAARQDWESAPADDALASVLSLNPIYRVEVSGGFVSLASALCPACPEVVRSLCDVFDNGIQEMHVLDVGHRLALRCREVCTQAVDLPGSFHAGFVAHTVGRSGEFKVEANQIFTRKQWIMRYGSEVKEVAYATLERIGAPVHFRELASCIRAESRTFSQVSDDRIGTCLRHGEEFKIAGRGTYGLATWKTKPYRSHGRAVVELLLACGEPLRGSAIVARLARDGNFKELNIRVALATHSRVVQIAPDTYDLKERVDNLTVAYGAKDLIVMLGPDQKYGSSGDCSGLMVRTAELRGDSRHEGHDRGKIGSGVAITRRRAVVDFTSLDQLIAVTTEKQRNSYRSALMLAILDTVDRRGAGNLSQISDRFLAFYLDRFRRGLEVERVGSRVLAMFAQDQATALLKITDLLKCDLLPELAGHGFIAFDGRRVQTSATLNEVLRAPELVVRLRSALGACLARYFGKAGGSNR